MVAVKVIDRPLVDSPSGIELYDAEQRAKYRYPEVTDNH